MQVLYNHYKEHFDTLDGCLPAIAIDSVYCFHAAFRGDFRLHLHLALPGIKGEGARAEEEVAPLRAHAAEAAEAAEAAGSGGAAAVAAEPGVHSGPHACGDITFVGLPHGAVYKVIVEDDPAHAPKGPPPPIHFLAGGRDAAVEGFVARAGKGGAAPGVGGSSRGVQELTRELKGLAVEELSGEKYKALLEAREIEMALYQ